MWVPGHYSNCVTCWQAAIHKPNFLPIGSFTYPAPKNCLNMQLYCFFIPNKKLFIYQVLAYGIIALNILGYFLYNLKTGGKVFNIVPISILFVVLIGIDIYRHKVKKALLPIGIFLILCGMFWMSIGLYQILILNLLFWALYRISKRSLNIAVTESGINYPSFPVKNIEWNDLNNIILKDDILTIDLKNNKIYQHLINYMDGEINEEEFNDFCKHNMAKV